ncbi:putative disease resistance protein RGA4 [Oryza brachyantha]|uniref:NB-ARC domain-containing protein n=1 Tax=Oryza brachyantha TaxID=4533 RepID=J3LNC2_ORYBR|nr:putative disease resistance protein RGA4 [Oryza brachyantha]
MSSDKSWLEMLKAKDITEKIGTFLFNLAWSKGTRLWNVEEEAEKLRRTEKRIRALLTDAEQRRYIDDESVKLWLLELKAVAYDAETLLDRLTTFTAVAKLDSTEPSRKRKRSWLPVQLGPRQRWGLDAKIAEINERLDEIARGRRRFRFQQGDAARRAQPGQRPRFLEVATCPDESSQSQIIGRGKEKEEVVQALLSDHDISLPVISIYGAAGIGKTTLARWVYHDDKVQDLFPTKIWVCLSDKCGVTKATKMIMEAVTKVKCDALSLDILQQQLREHLSTTKFLLVIDNLWAEDYNFWELLRCPLLAGEKGSKVLITTRNERVWRRTSTIHPLHLKGLSLEECWLLLKKYALLNGQGMENDSLSTIGRMIARDCQGSPLAAKSLGMLLSETNGEEEEWLNISNQMRILNEDQNNILPSLQISYHHLPYHLKQMFALCCLFPIWHEFEKDEVIRLWIAEGLIQCNGRRRLEAEGGRFFDELLWRSFFVSSDSSTNQRYRVPSLMNELALLVSKSEFLCIEPGNLQADINADLVRYASILCQKDESPELSMLYIYENIRILRLSTQVRIPLKCVPSDLFLKLRCLRTLDISNSQLEELPDSVGCLTHLRYIGLRKTLIKRLPESISALFNLQTLDLRECYRLTELPEGLSRLVNLRHLDLHLEWDRVVPIAMPRGIDKLTSLQTLSRFTVIADGEAYCNMKELKNINIRGELCLLKLEYATHENVKESNLSGKQYVENLMLQWSYNNSQAVDEESTRVIESLRPHSKLRSLRIDRYPGKNFPGWMGESSFTYLEDLWICNCKNSQLLPSVGELPNLKKLHLEGMHSLQSMGALLGFPSLEVLTLWDMPNLQTWCESEEAEFPKLKELHISHCPRLQAMTNLPPELSKLEINNCGTLCSLPVLQHLRDLVVHRGSDQLIVWISRLISLTSLTLMHFLETTDIQQLQHLSALKRLKIGGFKQLLSVTGNSSMEALSSLEFLEISSCTDLQQFSVVSLQSLKDFKLRHCTKLEALPTGFCNLGSLRRIEIHDIPNLRIDAGDLVLPDSVSCLTLAGCPALEDWCKNAGAQRVNAIPNVKIGF